MTKKKQSFQLPNTEVLIVLVLVFSFITIAVFRCNSTKRSYQEIEEQVERDEDTVAEETSGVATTTPAATPPASTASEPTATYTPPPAPPTSIISKLYVTLEDLNLRTGPHLDSTSIARLPLFDEVFFMNEVTDFTQRISLGPEVADEPWIKIRTRKGRIGWVYGAGVNYYKKRRIPTATTATPSSNDAQ